MVWEDGVCAALGDSSPGCPLTFPGCCYLSTLHGCYSPLQIHPSTFFPCALHLTPNYKIIGNPTSFYYKTIPPKMTFFFNSMLPASTEWVGCRRGNRKKDICLEKGLPWDSGTDIFDICSKPTTVGNSLAIWNATWLGLCIHSLLNNALDNQGPSPSPHSAHSNLRPSPTCIKLHACPTSNNRLWFILAELMVTSPLP